MAGPTKLKTLKETHPRLDLFQVRVLRALYKGGASLLKDHDVMAWVFPQHERESATSYAERKARAFYDNDFALVINNVTAGLAQDPIAFDDQSGPSGTDKSSATAIPPYWAELMKHASPPMVRVKKTMDEVIREIVTEGLVTGWGWVLCDLPRADPAIATLAEQDAAGALRAYPVPYRSDAVLNWEEDGGELRWVRSYSSTTPAVGPEQSRDRILHTWRVWDAQTITTYQLALDKDGKDEAGREWKDDDIVPPIDDPAPHTFGVVPWIRFDCSGDEGPAMHIGGMIESRCRSLFNESCGETFLRMRNMFQQLYEFLGSEMGSPDQPVGENQEDPGRAGRDMRNRAPNIVQVRGADDDAKFVSPDMSGAAVNRQAIAEGREAIPRVTGQLALSTDTSGAMIRRSGDSKKQDKVAQLIVWGVVGKKALSFARSVLEMLARGRGDSEDSVPPARGYEHFDTEDASTRVEQHVALSTAPIHSATFQIEESILAAVAILGDGISADTKTRIRKDLESTITQDSIAMDNAPSIPPGHQLDDNGMPVPLPMKQPELPKLPPGGAKKK